MFGCNDICLHVVVILSIGASLIGSLRIRYTKLMIRWQFQLEPPHIWEK